MNLFQRIGYIDSNYLTVFNLTSLLDLNISLTEVKRIFALHEKYPKIQTTEIPSILSTFKISSFISRCDLENLDQSVLPALVNIRLYGLRTLVIIKEVRLGELLILHPFVGEVLIRNDEYNVIWDGFIIIVESYNKSFSSLSFKQDLIDEADNNHRFLNGNLNEIKNFLSKKECEYIISLFESQQPIANSPKDKNAVYGFNDKDEQQKILKNKIIKKAIEACTFDDMKIDNIICIRYLQNRMNSLHYDVLDIEKGKNKNSFVIYLNENIQGGETYFPQLNKLVSPSTGTALHFRSLDENNKIYDSSVHAGLPVISGVKYTCNVWLKY